MEAQGRLALGDVGTATYRPEPCAAPPLESKPVTRPQDVYDLLAPTLAPLVQERVVVVLLDNKHRVLNVVTVYQGTVNAAPGRLAEFLRDAIIANAPKILLAHNHPSGDPTPSPDDIATTTALREGAALFDIELLDHIVIGRDGRWLSLKERGHLDGGQR